MTEFIENNISLVAVYARVSTARQEEEGTIETQLSAVREHARQKGYTVVQEYMDDGWSGDDIVRPALDRLRQDVKAKLWQGVLMYDPDRLARRYSYQELVMDELRAAGIAPLFVTVSAPKNDEDRILYGVRGLFAQYERAKIAERFRLGKLRKINEGHILVSQPLYGYHYIPKRDKVHGYYEINEEEARVVRQMFEWVANEGLTIRKVVRRLQELDIKPRKSKRGVWNPSTLTALLRNGAFIGEAHWRSSIATVPENPISKEKYRKTKKSSRKARPKDEWMTVPVPPIIDRNLFERARKQLTEHVSRSPRNKKYEYLLGGKILCDCGQRRVGAARRKGKYLYYDCCDKILCFPLPRSCHENAINARVADTLTWQLLSEIMSSPELLMAQVERWMNGRQEKAKSATCETPAMEKQIAKLRLEEDRYNKAYGAGLFSVEQLKAYVTPLREKIAGLDLEMARARQEVERIGIDILPSEQEVRAFAEEAQAMLGDLSFEQKRAIVLNTVEKIVGTQRQLHVYGYIPVNINGAFEPNHRYGWNTIRHNSSSNIDKRVPFTFNFDLPPPDNRTVKRNGVPRAADRQYARAAVATPNAGAAPCN